MARKTRARLRENAHATLLEQSLRLEIRPGEIQFMSNHTCVHAVEFHTTGEHIPAPHKRKILRTWLEMPEVRCRRLYSMIPAATAQRRTVLQML